MEGDQILEVNGKNLKEASLEQAVAVLKVCYCFVVSVKLFGYTILALYIHDVKLCHCCKSNGTVIHFRLYLGK